uniref:Uncharacterized protein n=1 Tax=Anguilla anguilla TaxID=7936 RepID=A0A0E9TEK3_ANGAN
MRSGPPSSHRTDTCMSRNTKEKNIFTQGLLTSSWVNESELALIICSIRK